MQKDSFLLLESIFALFIISIVIIFIPLFKAVEFEDYFLLLKNKKLLINKQTNYKVKMFYNKNIKEYYINGLKREIYE